MQTILFIIVADFYLSKNIQQTPPGLGLDDPDVRRESGENKSLSQLILLWQ